MGACSEVGGVEASSSGAAGCTDGSDDASKQQHRLRSGQCSIAAKVVVGPFAPGAVASVEAFDNSSEICTLRLQSGALLERRVADSGCVQCLVVAQTSAVSAFD